MTVTTGQVLSAIATLVVGFGVPLLRRRWVSRKRHVAVTSTVEVERMRNQSLFQDQMLERLREVETRLDAADARAQDAAKENVRLTAEYAKLDRIATDLRDANRKLVIENKSLREIIVDLNTEIAALKRTMETLSAQLTVVTCTASKCATRTALTHVDASE